MKEKVYKRKKKKKFGLCKSVYGKLWYFLKRLSEKGEFRGNKKKKKNKSDNKKSKKKKLLGNLIRLSGVITNRFRDTRKRRLSEYG